LTTLLLCSAINKFDWVVTLRTLRVETLKGKDFRKDRLLFRFLNLGFQFQSYTALVALNDRNNSMIGNTFSQHFFINSSLDRDFILISKSSLCREVAEPEFCFGVEGNPKFPQPLGIRRSTGYKLYNTSSK